MAKGLEEAAKMTDELPLFSERYCLSLMTSEKCLAAIREFDRLWGGGKSPATQEQMDELMIVIRAFETPLTVISTPCSHGLGRYMEPRSIARDPSGFR